MTKTTDFRNKLQDDIRNELHDIRNIYLYGRGCFLILRELYRTIDDSAYLARLKNRPFFDHLKRTYCRIVILELYKLYEENERFSIIKLLKKCQKGCHFASLNIDQLFIQDKLEKMTGLAEKIELIKKSRDKFCAHTDSSYKDMENELTFDEFEVLFTLCKEILGGLYTYGLKGSFRLEENDPVKDFKLILNSLDENNRREEEDMLKSYAIRSL